MIRAVKIPHDLSPVEILPFSYEEVLQTWGKSDPGVKTDGFQNTAQLSGLQANTISSYSGKKQYKMHPSKPIGSALTG